jgi:hypothetical protein
VKGSAAAGVSADVAPMRCVARPAGFRWCAPPRDPPPASPRFGRDGLHAGSPSSDEGRDTGAMEGIDQRHRARRRGRRTTTLRPPPLPPGRRKRATSRMMTPIAMRTQTHGSMSSAP